VAMQQTIGLSLILVCLSGGCTNFASDSLVRDANSAPSICEQAPSSVIQDSSVTLAWTPPTRNTDGSRLNDLAGYRIDWGRSNGEFTECVLIDNPEQSSYVVGNLAPGNYKFVILTINTAGVVSDPSSVAYRSVP
jgi:hypothetical protein